MLDAAVECLIEFGYSATTTTTVAEWAGVSRGAQLHHYPTKVELLTAAIDHLSIRLGHQLAEEATRLSPNGDRPSAVANTILRAIRDPPRARQERESKTVEAWKRLVVRTLTQ